jgi:hypothetical protein
MARYHNPLTVWRVWFNFDEGMLIFVMYTNEGRVKIAIDDKRTLKMFVNALSRMNRVPKGEDVKFTYGPHIKLHEADDGADLLLKVNNYISGSRMKANNEICLECWHENIPIATTKSFRDKMILCLEHCKEYME